VIVDGAPRRGTAYTLSHWPGTPTPAGLTADLSAEIVRLALQHPEELPVRVDVASIDHFDADGIIALGLLVVDGLDAEYGPLLVEAARVGDFDVVTDTRAALIAFALHGVLGSARETGTVLGVTPGSGDALALCGRAAHEALSSLFDLAADPEGHEALWHDEWNAYEASTRALAEGWASIEEFPDIDLAVVRLDRDHAGAADATWGQAPIHRAAVHSATTCLRVATVVGRRMELRYRYESWVRMARNRPRPRVDLEPLAAEFTAEEKAGARWVFDGAGSITGALHLDGDASESTIDPGRFVETVSRYVKARDRGPAAWDPYAPASPTA
jgi:hypothetical protein